MPYADYSAFGHAYFEGGSVADPDPAGYSDYTQTANRAADWATTTADLLTAAGVDLTTARVLVVGCGYGYTVEQLVAHGVNAYGLDQSAWAVAQAPDAVTDRIVHGDATTTAAFDAAEQAAGGAFDAIMTEAMLSCLTDAEARTVCQHARDRATTTLHRVWATDGSDLNTDYYNDHTLAEWQYRCDPAGEAHWVTEQTFRPGGR